MKIVKMSSIMAGDVFAFEIKVKERKAYYCFKNTGKSLLCKVNNYDNARYMEIFPRFVIWLRNFDMAGK